MKLHVQKRLCHSNRLGPKKSVWLCVNPLPEIAEKKSDICTGLDLLNADKHNFRSCYQMNTKYMFIIAAMAVMLIGATAFATTDSAFADGKKKYEKNQAISQANACGNGELPLNVGCQNVDSQIQGDENVVALAADQAFPEEEP
jgi:hypothetical protein